MRATVTARLAALAAILLAAGSARAQAGPSWGDEQRAVVRLIEDVEAANNAGDVAAWVEFFADDAVYMAPGTPAVTTRKGLVDVAERGFRHSASIDVEPLEIVVDGPWAWARNRVTGTVTVSPTGDRVVVDSKQLVIYLRTETGEWRIHRMITNSNS